MVFNKIFFRGHCYQAKIHVSSVFACLRNYDFTIFLVFHDDFAFKYLPSQNYL